MVNEIIDSIKLSGCVIDDGTPSYPLLITIVNRDLEALDSTTVFSQMHINQMRGYKAWPLFHGVMKVAERICSIAGRTEVEVEDLKGAFWLLAPRPLRNWLSDNLPVSWSIYSPKETVVLSALRAHSFGLPFFDVVPPWWIMLDPGTDAATTLSARRVAMVLCAPEMLRLDIGIVKPPSTFVHLSSLSPAYHRGGLEEWLVQALACLPWMRYYEQVVGPVEGHNTLLRIMARASAERLELKENSMYLG